MSVIRRINATVIKAENNTATTTIPNLTVSNDGTGDASIRMTAGGTTYHMGVDNSLSDRFGISANSTNVSANAGIVMDSAGRVGIQGAPGATTALAVISTTTGFLPPVMTSAQAIAISTPATGLITYNSSSGGLMYYDGTIWRFISGATLS